MKTKFVFSTENMDHESWTDLPFIPRQKEWIYVPDFLKYEELLKLRNSANCWSGSKGVVDAVAYRYKENETYTEIMVWCED